MKKTLATAIAVMLTCFTCLIGTTFAWMIAQTDPINNSFTIGDINIMLRDSTSTNKTMVPGATLTENQTVTVLENSEDCWLFIHAHKHNEFDKYLSFEYAEGWTKLEGSIDVYWRRVDSSTEAQVFGLIKDETVYVNSDLTKEDFAEIDSNTLPTLTFTAYAVQRIGFPTPADAWVEAEKLGFG